MSYLPEQTLDMIDILLRISKSYLYIRCKIQLTCHMLILLIFLLWFLFSSLCPRVSWKRQKWQLCNQISGPKNIKTGKTALKSTFYRFSQLNSKILSFMLNIFLVLGILRWFAFCSVYFELRFMFISFHLVASFPNIIQACSLQIKMFIVMRLSPVLRVCLRCQRASSRVYHATWGRWRCPTSTRSSTTSTSS